MTKTAARPEGRAAVQRPTAALSSAAAAPGLAPIPPVAVPVAIPPMVVFEPASRSVPVTADVAAAVVVRRHPVGTRERGPRPVAVMPGPSPAVEIPVALHPFVVGPRPRRDTI